MKNRDNWEEEMESFGSWLPQKGEFFEHLTPPTDYFNDFEDKLKLRIKQSSQQKRRKYIISIISVAAGFLIMLSLSKFLWLTPLNRTITVEPNFSDVSKEEAKLWINEEANISEVDMQLIAEDLTFLNLNIKQ